MSVAIRRNLKLAAKFYGPFEIIRRIGQLKKVVGGQVVVSKEPSHCTDEGQILTESLAILERRMAKKGNKAVVQVNARGENDSKAPSRSNTFAQFIWQNLPTPSIHLHHGEPKQLHYIDSATDYPIPLSPPMPDISKEIEPHRALTASLKSSLFTLSRSHVIFEDEWLIAVNKPQGIYCETVLSSLPALLTDTGANVSELHLANRLDRDTSGVMLITKLHKVAAKFVKAFASGW
uniref:Uncharacterized protein LOC104236965 n=1 Tax=Nicotiana sylvestris TaxID=4096 RepID=A0A1U7XI40_NICSY|nr:PREDICTED: uncharacterized protein LOC104236965 [Nicotiana sylvestris]